MFRNYLAAALRNLMRNRLYAAIIVSGLSVGFTTALLIVLVVRDALSYDRFWPDHERVYRISFMGHFTGKPPAPIDMINAEVAPRLKLDVPFAEASVRLTPRSVSVLRGIVKNAEPLYWADPDLFAVLSFQSVAGNLNNALRKSGSAVLTHTVARKYFGGEDPIGKIFQIEQSGRRITLQVTAVVQDLPSNSHLDVGIIASGHSPDSPLTKLDALPERQDAGIYGEVFTYLKLKPRTQPAALSRALSDYSKKHVTKASWGSYSLRAIPIAAIHMTPGGLGAGAVKPSGNMTTLYMIAALALLIVLVAGINFVNLMTARAGRRAIEVGVRKAAGAAQLTLMVQFIGEALIYIVFSLLVAMAAVELLLPALNAFLDHTIVLEYGDNLSFVAAVASVAVLTGIAAGAYPAVVMSAFKPSAVLKGAAAGARSPATVRRILAIGQFAILIALIAATNVIHRQTDYALKEGVRLDHDEVLLINGGCREAFRNAVGALPGVMSVACSDSAPTNVSMTLLPIDLPAGGNATFLAASVDAGFLELFGLKPLAGRFLSREHGADVPESGTASPRLSAVINETAVRTLDLPSAQAALGMFLTLIDEFRDKHPTFEVVGVAPDFATNSLRQPIEPALYFISPATFRLLSVKLSGRDIPETLHAIDKLWTQLGDSKPISRQFFDEYLQGVYSDIIRQTTLLSILTTIAMVIACLGLFGLSAFMAESRTKEIGVRKAMGARTSQVMCMFLLDSTKPVLWAALIAWPAGYYCIRRWLEGFTYRVELGLWTLPAATAAALAIALLTVTAHAVLVARAKPVEALRYE